MTGLELLKAPDTTAEQIADIVAEQCPPVALPECDGLSCRGCWISWLTTGEPPKAMGPSDKQTAPSCARRLSQGKKREVSQFGRLLEEVADYVSSNDPYKPHNKQEERSYTVTHLGVSFLGEYYSNQELISHIGEAVFVRSGEKGYEAVTKYGASLGLLTPHRREGQ